MLKNEVREALIGHLQTKLEQLNNLMAETREATAGETKSTAGDKHETGRAMAQLEQEKLGKQILETSRLLENAKRLTTETHSIIQQGSLMKCNNNWYYLSVGTGKITFAGQDIFCLTAISPFGKELLGKKTGDQVHLNSELTTIQTVE